MRRSAQQPTTTLQSYRLRAGLTIRGLGRHAGVPGTTVRNAELGRIPHPPTQAKIAAALSLALGEPVSTLDLWPLVPRGEEVA